MHDRFARITARSHSVASAALANASRERQKARRTHSVNTRRGGNGLRAHRSTSVAQHLAQHRIDARRHALQAAADIDRCAVIDPFAQLVGARRQQRAARSRASPPSRENARSRRSMSPRRARPRSRRGSGNRGRRCARRTAASCGARPAAMRAFSSARASRPCRCRCRSGSSAASAAADGSWGCCGCAASISPPVGRGRTASRCRCRGCRRDVACCRTSTWMAPSRGSEAIEYSRCGNGCRRRGQRLRIAGRARRPAAGRCARDSISPSALDGRRRVDRRVAVERNRACEQAVDRGRRIARTDLGDVAGLPLQACAVPRHKRDDGKPAAPALPGFSSRRSISRQGWYARRAPVGQVRRGRRAAPR